MGRGGGLGRRGRFGSRVVSSKEGVVGGSVLDSSSATSSLIVVGIGVVIVVVFVVIVGVVGVVLMVVVVAIDEVGVGFETGVVT